MSQTNIESRASEKKVAHVTVPTNLTLSHGDTLHVWYQVSGTNGAATSWEPSESTGGTLEQRLVDIPARRQIDHLGGRIEVIETKLAGVEERLKGLEYVEPRVVAIRQIDEPTAESEIVNYLKTHGEADTAELVENLGIDIDMVLAVVQHLKNDGKVERVADSHESR